jgi:hypothetical protein
VVWYKGIEAVGEKEPECRARRSGEPLYYGKVAKGQGIVGQKADEASGMKSDSIFGEGPKRLELMLDLY